MKKLLPTLFISLVLVGGMVVHAEEKKEANTDKTETNINAVVPNPFKTGETLTELFKTIAEKILLPIGGVIAVLAFIWAGFKFVTAQGDEKKISEARTALLYTAIGTLILLGATVIASVLDKTVNSLKV